VIINGYLPPKKERKKRALHSLVVGDSILGTFCPDDTCQPTGIHHPRKKARYTQKGISLKRTPLPRANCCAPNLFLKFLLMFRPSSISDSQGGSRGECGGGSKCSHSIHNLLCRANVNPSLTNKSMRSNARRAFYCQKDVSLHNLNDPSGERKEFFSVCLFHKTSKKRGKAPKVGGPPLQLGAAFLQGLLVKET